MALFMDARIRLRIGAAEDAGSTDALLVEGEIGALGRSAQACFTLPQATAHPIGCACCLPRGPVAEALSRLFLQRVRGDVPHFAEVIAVPSSAEGEAAIRTALHNDAVVCARFRLVE
jgi:hypothetical protein